MSIRYLKIKVKSLAAEATMIRKEENKAKSHYRYLAKKQGREWEYEQTVKEFWGLRHHRKWDVGTESRAALIAYGYLRGLQYSQIEKPDKCNSPDWSRIKRLAVKYGPTNARPIVGDTLIDQWREEV
jgi:hypothetical protein